MSAFDENPFADPSVQQATASSGQSAGLDNYDPFNKQNTTTTAAGGQPAVMSPTQEAAPAPMPPPAYTQSAQQTATAADFQRRQEELERKAAELARREEELKASPYNVRANNWPPLPGFIPIQPCFYQDINVDIPVEFQETVKRLYYMWLLHTAVILANLFGGVCYLFSGIENGTLFGMGLLWAILGTPVSYLCWFRPAYKAFKSDSSMYFMIFFLTFAIQLIFSIIMAVGFSSAGGCGLILMITTFTGAQRGDGTGAHGGDYFLGFVALLVTIGWVVCALGDFFMLTKIHGYYRATGASMSKAQSEFTTNMFQNEAVRNAAASAAAAGVRQGFQQQTGQQQAPRY